MPDTLIVNARLVNEGREFDGDLRISRGRIDAIGHGLSARAGETVVDAAGRRLLPGMIDRHDAGVREFCALPGANAHATEARALRDAQQVLVERMRERQARLLELIRRQRQTSQAATAYAGAAAG